MSFTALAWVVLYCSAMVFSLSNPLFASLGYLLEYYMRPELKWWGDDLPALRYNLMMSLALGATFLMRRSSLRELLPVPNLALRWLYALAAVMTVVTVTVAVNTEVSWSWAFQWMKMAIIFPALLIGVVRSRNAFNAFAIVNIIGAGYWGYNAWMDPKRDAGRLANIGSGDSLDDNSAAAHLLTVLPLAVTYFFVEKDKKMRAVALIATPLIVNTLILCNSRGSMVGLAAALLVALVTIRRGYRLRIIWAGVATVAVLFMLADNTFITRQQTTAEYEEDGSAVGRLETWKGAMRLIRDRPFGAGGRGFHLLSPIYIPEVVAAHGGDLRAPHNTYAMVPAEWGIIGFICFIGIYASAFVMLRRVMKTAQPSEEGFYYWRAFAVQLGLVAYLVAATFTDRLYGEAGYWLVALSYVLYRLQRTEQEAAKPAPTEVAEVPAAAAAAWKPRLVEARLG